MGPVDLLVDVQASLAAQGPPHTQWNLLSYQFLSCVCVCLTSWVPVGPGFELSEEFRCPLTSRAIKALWNSFEPSISSLKSSGSLGRRT